MKYDKKQALDIIVKAAKNYRQNLQDRSFLIVYQSDKGIGCARVGFRKNHFLHMTGVETNLSAQRFYEKCINGKLSISEFELDQKGKTQRKLVVLPYLSELLYNNCMIGDFINSGIFIRADYFVGNTKAVLSVGFRYGKKVDYPVTLYNEDIKKLSRTANKVLAIFLKKHSEQQYKECTYLSKGQAIDELPISEEIRKEIKVDIKE